MKLQKAIIQKLNQTQNHNTKCFPFLLLCEDDFSIKKYFCSLFSQNVSFRFYQISKQTKTTTMRHLMTGAPSDDEPGRRKSVLSEKHPHPLHRIAILLSILLPPPSTIKCPIKFFTLFPFHYFFLLLFFLPWGGVSPTAPSQLNTPLLVAFKKNVYSCNNKGLWLLKFAVKQRVKGIQVFTFYI